MSGSNSSSAGGSSAGWYSWAFSTGASLGATLGARGMDKMQNKHNDAMAAHDSRALALRNTVAALRARSQQKALEENNRRRTIVGYSQMDALSLESGRLEQDIAGRDLAQDVSQAEARGRMAAAQASSDTVSTASAYARQALAFRQGVEAQAQDREAQGARENLDRSRATVANNLLWGQESAAVMADVDGSQPFAPHVPTQGLGETLVTWASGVDWQQGATLKTAQEG